MDRFRMIFDFDGIDLEQGRKRYQLMRDASHALSGLKDANLTVHPLQKGVTYFTDIPEPGPGEKGA